MSEAAQLGIGGFFAISILKMIMDFLKNNRIEEELKAVNTNVQAMNLNIVKLVIIHQKGDANE